MNLFFVVICLVSTFFLANGEVIVKLPFGKVIGNKMISENGRAFYSFRGIPYAEPPVGKLRFEPPVPKYSWQDNPINATNDGPECANLDIVTKQFLGQEDCLYLNVYSSQLSSEENPKLPVMVYFHGGGFSIGSGSSVTYHPRRLIDTGIVLVTLNYRLGSLGFLSTADSVSPGNYGMLDQVEALQWIKRNIQYFGGDADNIVLFGNSAGGASVIYHLLSPLSNGLFHKAIALSGSPLCSWAFQPEPLVWARKSAIALACPAHDSQIMIDCLKQIPAEKLIKATHSLNVGFLPIVFSPTVDNNFLSENPLKLLVDGRINKVNSYLAGITKEEGCMMYAFLKLVGQMDHIKTTQLNQLIQNIVGATIFNTKATELIKNEYFHNVDLNNRDDMKEAWIKLQSHASFDACFYQTGQLMAKSGIPTFLYSYDFEHQFSLTDSFGIKAEGVGHMDDLFMIFDGEYFESMIKDERSNAMKEKYQQLIKNFVKFGNPTAALSRHVTLEWPAAQPDKLWIYHINDELNTSIYNPDEHRSFKFWTETIPTVIRIEKEHIKEEL